MRTATLHAGAAVMGQLARALKMFARRPSPPVGAGAPAGSGDELRLYRQVLAQSGDAVMIVAAGGTIEYVNAAFEKLTGYAAAEVIGRRPSMFKSGEHDGAFYARLRAALEQGRSFRAVFINRNKGGSLYHEEKTISPIRDHAGRTTHFVAVGRNVNARIATERRLHYLAYYDALTGLPNRVLFQQRLDDILEREVPAEHGLVVLLRVDDLQRINDSLGRRAGDRALRLVAGRLQAFCAADGSVARWGGDAFVVLAGSHSAAARRAGQGILDVLDEPLDVGQCKVVLTASVGIARYPQPARTAEELMRQAEFDLRRSGTGGRSGFLRHHESPRAEADRIGPREIGAGVGG